MTTAQFDASYGIKQLNIIYEKYVAVCELYESLSQRETITKDEVSTLSKMTKDLFDTIDAYYTYLEKKNVDASDSYLTKWLYYHDNIDRILDIRYMVQRWEANIA
jgi:hypothetical protein